MCAIFDLGQNLEAGKLMGVLAESIPKKASLKNVISDGEIYI
jgi:hypothetical protein